MARVNDRLLEQSVTVRFDVDLPAGAEEEPVMAAVSSAILEAVKLELESKRFAGATISGVAIE